MSPPTVAQHPRDSLRTPRGPGVLLTPPPALSPLLWSRRFSSLKTFLWFLLLLLLLTGLTYGESPTVTGKGGLSRWKQRW